MSDYEIDKKLPAPRGTKCNCGHSVEVHGTNGKICGGCECRAFVQAFDPKKPQESKMP